MADTEAPVAQPVAALNEVGDTTAVAKAESAPESAATPAVGGDEDPKKAAAPAAGAARAAAPRKKPPQRELVIPDEPVKRYPEPAKAELDAKLEPLRAQVAEARTKLEAALTHSKARKAVLDSHEASISAARKAHKGLQEALNAKFTAKKVEQRIQDLEYRMHTESLPMAEEKKLIAIIAYLRHKGRAALVAADAASVSRDELEASRKAQDVLINQLKAAVNEQKGVVDAAYAARNAEVAQLPGAPSQTGDPIAAQKKVIAEAQSAMDAAHKAHYAALNAPTATAEALASVAAEDKSAKAGDAPTLGLPGATRQGLRVVKGTSASVVTGKKAGAAAPPEDKYSAFGKAGVGKKGRKGKGRRGSDAAAPDTAAAASSAGSAKLPSQSMEIYAAFTAVEVEPPLVKSDVAPAIKALQEKLAYYKTAPPPTQRAPKQQLPFGSSAEKRGASKNAAAAPTPSSNEDEQPPLVQGAPLPSVPATVDANKPSFSDIIRGRAAAAAAPSNESPTPAEAGSGTVLPVAALLATDGGDGTEAASDPTAVADDELANGNTEVTAADLNAVTATEGTVDATTEDDAAPTKSADAPSTDTANPEGVTA
ncbi:hypothetical protein I4F81_001818 [Pyropia yezoensis]|uniref:Uncharacterized protein n=1 Tax=Pyropia yezoensis TaxID=2788 RepID=A0ACC3BNZ3_PYRYE|nr:hypothetical protein I4F81_001818 [Neopyropia yezoensis]